jgi:hypothetical protein
MGQDGNPQTRDEDDLQQDSPSVQRFGMRDVLSVFSLRMSNEFADE